MNPRASAPSTMSGFSGRANVGELADGLPEAPPRRRRSGMMSLKTMPGFGKPGMSRM